VACPSYAIGIVRFMKYFESLVINVDGKKTRIAVPSEIGSFLKVWNEAVSKILPLENADCGLA
jgi:hypothetical protein